MSRTIPSNVDTSLDDAFVLPVFFVELDFDTDPVYLHTDIGDIAVLAHTWLGTGGLGTISPIEETGELRAQGVKTRMQITDESAGSIFEELSQQDFYQRPAKIYFSTRDTSSGDLLDDPFELWRGKCDVPEMVHGEGLAFVDLLIESEWVDGKRANGQKYTDAQLQSENPGDLAFAFMAQMPQTKIIFGSRRTVRFASAAGGVSGYLEDFNFGVRPF